MKTIHPDLCERTNMNIDRLKVISGGQTGVDIKALEAARSIGVSTGGTCPKGFITSSGRNTSLKNIYNLEELESTLPLGAQYVIRSKKNVDDADAVLAYSLYNSIGTMKTIGYAQSKKWIPCKSHLHLRISSNFEGWYVLNGGHRPVFVVASVDPSDTLSVIEGFSDFLAKNTIHTLNVCGHRGSKEFNRYSDGCTSSLKQLLEIFISDR